MTCKVCKKPLADHSVGMIGSCMNDLKMNVVATYDGLYNSQLHHAAVRSSITLLEDHNEL